MPNEMQPRNPRELWQSQEVEKVAITIDEIQKRAARFERRIRRRNIVEYAGGTSVIVLFVLAALRNPGWRAIPQYLLIAGVLYAMLQLHGRASARFMPRDVALRASVQWHREELERHRAALRAIWRWYLLPLVPGLVAILIVGAVEHGVTAFWYICCFGFPAVLAGIWALNRRAARRLDRQIDELRSMQDAVR
jgi:hypothetical protein